MSNRHIKAAEASAKVRAAEVSRKVEAAMKTIVDEMNANGGIYPYNGGAISKNEVARRAGISTTTLFTSKQKALGKRVTLWLDGLKKKETVGRMRVRRSFAERADDWKARYEALKDSHIKTELDLMQAQAERDEALAKVTRLLDEKASLLKQLNLASNSKIKHILKGKP